MIQRTQNYHFGPWGPTTPAEAAAYREVAGVIRAVEQQAEVVRGLDNSAEDADGRLGRVVTSTAELRYDPANGHVSWFSASDSGISELGELRRLRYAHWRIDLYQDTGTIDAVRETR